MTEKATEMTKPANLFINRVNKNFSKVRMVNEDLILEELVERDLHLNFKEVLTIEESHDRI